MEKKEKKETKQSRLKETKIERKRD